MVPSLLIYKYRRLDKLYDILEAYKVLCEQNILSTMYDLSDELPFVDHVFSCVEELSFMIHSAHLVKVS